MIHHATPEFAPPAIPADEDERLEDLRRLDMLLTMPEETFDRVTRELARVFGVSGVVMSFTDRDTMYVKSAVGLPPHVAETRTEPRELAVCSHVIGGNEMLVVEDLLADDRFRDNPEVLASGARFYAGAPLRADSGRAVGSLCIVDGRPRAIGARERDLLRLVAEGAMAQVKLEAASRQLLRRSRQVARDLQLAEQVQRFALPSSPIEGEGWRVTHVYQPYEHLGGDFLDVLPRPDGRVAIIMADVSGHGTSAALTAAMAKTAFNRAAPTAETPAALLETLNRELFDLAPPNQFMTAVAAFLDPAGRVIEISSAGHPLPLMVGDSRVAPVVHDHGIPLLVDHAASYASSTSVPLPAGSRLVFYTDGAFEAVDPDGRHLGLDGLARCVRDANAADAGDLLEDVLARIAAHARGRFDDDVALLCVE